MQEELPHTKKQYCMFGSADPFWDPFLGPLFSSLSKIKVYLWVLVCIMRTLIRVAVKSHKLHFIPEFALAALLSSFFCKSKCMEDVGCSKIRTLCCSPPGLNLGCDIGLDGVTAASLTFFFGLAPDFGVASEIRKIILWPWHRYSWNFRPPKLDRKISPI